MQQPYAVCARITREHGTTYFWGVQLLPRESRRHVHAIYALCRVADDIVDAAGATTARVEQTRDELHAFRDRFDRAVERARSGHVESPAQGGAASAREAAVLAAAAATTVELGLTTEPFDRFFGAMAMDLDTTHYATWADLCGYMEGSAAVIGELMLPVLRPRSAAAFEPARALGLAFQLTNFLRDVGEDLDRGRVYLPQDDLARFGADPARRVADQPWREVLAFQIERNRQLYAVADTGIPHLPPRSARCVATARRLYSGILDRIEAADYDVFSTRARVPTWRKAATAAAIFVTGAGTTQR
ncbi:MAG: phytoene/squalene synthase family protein [Actinomycetales bacterium]|nr:phytoene/squalene synthase family protein [Actinomycetales bacterium]